MAKPAKSRRFVWPAPSRVGFGLRRDLLGHPHRWTRACGGSLRAEAALERTVGQVVDVSVEADALLDQQDAGRAVDLGADEAAVVVDNPFERAGARVVDGHLAVGARREGEDGGLSGHS